MSQQSIRQVPNESKHNQGAWRNGGVNPTLPLSLFLKGEGIGFALQLSVGFYLHLDRYDIEVSREVFLSSQVRQASNRHHLLFSIWKEALHEAWHDDFHHETTWRPHEASNMCGGPYGSNECHLHAQNMEQVAYGQSFMRPPQGNNNLYHPNNARNHPGFSWKNNQAALTPSGFNPNPPQPPKSNLEMFWLST